LGILSRLWIKNTARNSYVRRWLVQEREKDDSSQTDVFALFVELISSASCFGQEALEDRDSRIQEVAKQYLGDTTLFEIACYTYYRMTAWFADNQSEFRTKVADPVATWIVEVFSVAWRKDEELVGRFFAERLDRYRTIAGTGNDVEGIRLELEQRIINTQGDRFGKNDESSGPSRLEADHRFVKHALEQYEASHIPAVIKAAQDFCQNQTQQPLPPQKSLSIKEQSDQENRDYLFAMALLEQKDWVKACSAFTKVIGFNPENYNALLQRGQLHVKLNQPIAAIDDFSQAIAVNPRDSRAYLHRGKCYHQVLRQGDESLADYAKVIALEPDNPIGYFQRGSLYEEIALSFEQQASENKDQERHDKASKGFLAAIQEYSQAIALNPDYDDAYVSRGLAFARRAKAEGDAASIPRAVADLEKAMSLNWEHGYLYKTLDELRDLLKHSKSSQELTTV